METYNRFIYRHCHFCNGIFKSKSSNQMFCCKICSNGFVELNLLYSAYSIHNFGILTSFYLTKPSIELFNRYTTIKEKAFKWYQITNLRTEGIPEVNHISFSDAKDFLKKQATKEIVQQIHFNELIKIETIELEMKDKFLFRKTKFDKNIHIDEYKSNSKGGTKRLEKSAMLEQNFEH